MKNKLVAISLVLVLALSLVIVSCKNEDTATTTTTKTTTTTTTKPPTTTTTTTTTTKPPTTTTTTTTTKPPTTTTTTTTTTKPPTTTTTTTTKPPTTTTTTTTASTTVYENKDYKFKLEYPSDYGPPATNPYPSALLVVTSTTKPTIMINDPKGATLEAAIKTHLTEMGFSPEPIGLVVTDTTMGDGTPAKTVEFSFTYNPTLTILLYGFMVQKGDTWIIATTSCYGAYNKASGEAIINPIKASYKTLP